MANQRDSKLESEMSRLFIRIALPAITLALLLCACPSTAQPTTPTPASTSTVDSTDSGALGVLAAPFNFSTMGDAISGLGSLALDPTNGTVTYILSGISNATTPVFAGIYTAASNATTGAQQLVAPLLQTASDALSNATAGLTAIGGQISAAPDTVMGILSSPSNYTVGLTTTDGATNVTTFSEPLTDNVTGIMGFSSNLTLDPVVELQALAATFGLNYSAPAPDNDTVGAIGLLGTIRTDAPAPPPPSLSAFLPTGTLRPSTDDQTGTIQPNAVRPPTPPSSPSLPSSSPPSSTIATDLTTIINGLGLPTPPSGGPSPPADQTSAILGLLSALLGSGSGSSGTTGSTAGAGVPASAASTGSSGTSDSDPLEAALISALVSYLTGGGAAGPSPAGSAATATPATGGAFASPATGGGTTVDTTQLLGVLIGALGGSGGTPGGTDYAALSSLANALGGGQ